MSKIKAALKLTKYAALAVLGFAVLIGLWLLRTLFTADPSAPAKLPEVPKKLKEKVEKAEEEALIARVEARVEATQSKELLDEAAAIEDGEERRKRLADMLRRL
jgi:hypothetical protein